MHQSRRQRMLAPNLFDNVIPKRMGKIENIGYSTALKMT